MTQFVRHAFVCTSGKDCPRDGPALGVYRAAKDAVAAAQASDRVRVSQSGCLGQCGHGPMMVVYPEGVWYSHLTVDEARRIAATHLVGGTVAGDLAYDPARPGNNKVARAGAPPDVAQDRADGVACSRCPTPGA